MRNTPKTLAVIATLLATLMLGACNDDGDEDDDDDEDDEGMA
jgi:hypothetical protein